MTACWFCGRTSHADRIADHDHGFTTEQRIEYGALPWRGRDAYDHFRWYVAGMSHEQAYAAASLQFPPKVSARCSHCRREFGSETTFVNHLLLAERYPEEDAYTTAANAFRD